MCSSCCSTPLVGNMWACVFVSRLLDVGAIRWKRPTWHNFSPSLLLCLHTVDLLTVNKNRKMKENSVRENKLSEIHLSPGEKWFTRASPTFFFLQVRQYNPFKNPLPQTPQLSINSRWEGCSDPDESPLSLLPPPGCRIENCESCFSKDFCTKCKSGFFLHKGRCFDKCPEGFAPLEDTMECGGTCNNTDMYKKFLELLIPFFNFLYKVFDKFSVGLLILENKQFNWDHTQQGYSTSVNLLHPLLKLDLWVATKLALCCGFTAHPWFCVSCRGLRGGPVERMGSLHQEKQNLWL